MIVSLKALQCVPYIQYLVPFPNNKVKALLNFDGKVNAMTLFLTAKLDFTPQKTTINTQKIDSLALETFRQVIVELLLYNKLDKSQFFEKTFLLAEIRME